MKITAACAAALALLATAGAASAQDVDFSFNAALTSDYVFRGASQSNEEAALQGGVDLTAGSFYAGVWASTVDFGDETQAEIDLYTGFRTEAAGYALDFGVIGYVYADDDQSSDYDYLELKAAASRAFGPATIGAAVYYSPDFFGSADEEATYVEVNAAFSPIDKVTVSGAVGNQYLDVSDDYLTWNLGATYAFTDNLALDVRYHDTDFDGSYLYDGRVNATIKALF